MFHTEFKADLSSALAFWVKDTQMDKWIYLIRIMSETLVTKNPKQKSFSNTKIINH